MSVKPPQPKLIGSKVELVSYEPYHVSVYHKWMQSINLLELTASERLTLEQETINQVEWKSDRTKVCYIILDRSKPITQSIDQSVNQSINQSTNQSTNQSINQDEYEMVGDVNLFMHDWLDPGTAELEVMIAVESSRRKGLAQESLEILMKYAVEYFQIHKFMVKIGASNNQSINLFVDRLGFKQVDYSEAFDEVELVGPDCLCEQCDAKQLIG